MPAGLRARWGWSGLRLKLLLSHLSVVVVGIVTLLLAANVVAPSFFETHMAQMMGGAEMERMTGPGVAGQSGQAHAEAFDVTLAATFRAAQAQALLVASAAGVAAAIGASLFVTGRVLGPVRRLAVASRRLASGHYAERVSTDADDELGELAASFNAMADVLESTERRRLELIGDVAHELRTPIATLEGYLEGLLDGVVEPGERTWAKLHDEAGRLRRLVDDLQELSRAEARQISLRPESIDPADIVRAALDRLTGQFEEKELSLTVELSARLPRVWADRDRAVQVLTNLLTNALRYSPAPGSVRVRARASDGGVQFCVADTGVGIAAEQLPRLFERFYRVDKSRSRVLGGSGVGLTIARALVEAMGGRIWAASGGPGQGATFTFCLPTAH